MRHYVGFIIIYSGIKVIQTSSRDSVGSIHMPNVHLKPGSGSWHSDTVDGMITGSVFISSGHRLFNQPSSFKSYRLKV